MHPDYTVIRLPTVAEINAYCRAKGQTPMETFNKKTIEACVLRDRLEVVLPRKGLFDEKKTRKIEEHEFAHTRNIGHRPTGKEWLNADGTPAIDLSPEMVKMIATLEAADMRQRLAEQRSSDFRAKPPIELSVK